MSNYPPGVTGNEFEISGPDREFDDERECGNDGAVIHTVTGSASKLLEGLINADDELPRSTIRSMLRTLLNEIEEVDLEGMICPFVGDVTVSGYRNIEWWTCPVCRTEHEKEID